MISKTGSRSVIGYIPVFSIDNVDSAYYSLLTGSIQCGYITTS